MSCHGCEFVGKYPQIPARWGEYFTPGKLNRHFPKPLPGCPKLTGNEQPESVSLGEFA